MTKPLTFLSIFAIGAISLASCKSSGEAASSSAPTDPIPMEKPSSEPQLLASIERTACYGQCPIYKATFMDNGEVIYVGKNFVENIGTYSTLISEEDVLEIQKKIVEYDYFALDSLYPTPISDFPSCITEVRLNGRSKKVIDRRAPPENLKAFEKFLDSLLEGRELKKVSDEKVYEKR